MQQRKRSGTLSFVMDVRGDVRTTCWPVTKKPACTNSREGALLGARAWHKANRSKALTVKDVRGIGESVPAALQDVQPAIVITDSNSATSHRNDLNRAVSDDVSVCGFNSIELKGRAVDDH